MIDLHFHCLPGIDDGPRDWDEAVSLCRAAAADGIDTIVATPHVLRDPWLNEDPAERADLLAELNRRVGGTPRILPGCEYFFSSDAVELWEMKSNGPLLALNNSKYLLVEFPAGNVPASARAVFFELSLMNVVPVVAHPERNLVFSGDPSRLAALVEAGAVAQVTAGSLVGDFGKRAQMAAEAFIRGGLAAVVASDAHSVDRRAPRMQAARERVARLFGKAVEDGLFGANPTAIIKSEDLPFGPDR